jgi:type IV secretory pathway TrbL component
MLKGKNLWIALGVGAVAYYLWMQNKKNKAAKVVAGPSTAAINFTGDLDVPAYQNANGDTTRKRVDTISGSSPFKHVVLKGNKPKQ